MTQILKKLLYLLSLISFWPNQIIARDHFIIKRQINPCSTLVCQNSNYKKKNLILKQNLSFFNKMVY